MRLSDSLIRQSNAIGRLFHYTVPLSSLCTGQHKQGQKDKILMVSKFPDHILLLTCISSL